MAACGQLFLPRHLRKRPHQHRPRDLRPLPPVAIYRNSEHNRAGAAKRLKRVQNAAEGRCAKVCSLAFESD